MVMLRFQRTLRYRKAQVTLLHLLGSDCVSTYVTLVNSIYIDVAVLDFASTNVSCKDFTVLDLATSDCIAAQVYFFDLTVVDVIRKQPSSSCMTSRGCIRSPARGVTCAIDMSNEIV